MRRKMKAETYSEIHQPVKSYKFTLWYIAIIVTLILLWLIYLVLYKSG